MAKIDLKKREREMKTFGYAQKKSSLKGSRSSKKLGKSDILFNVWKAVEDMSYCMSLWWLQRDDTLHKVQSMDGYPLNIK